MRSVKNTSLGFGMVNIPIKMYVATESHDIAFHTYHGPQCLGGISMPRVCKECGETVDYGDILKGVEVDGQLVTVTKDDIETLDNEQESGGVEVVAFVHRDEVDPLMYEKTYYLDANTGSGKKENLGPARSYALLRQVLNESGRVGVVRFAMKQRTQMGVLRVVGDILAIHTLLWSDEVRGTQELQGARKHIELSPKEIKAAHSVVESLMGSWNPGDYTDDYNARMQEMIDAKAAGGVFTPKETKEAEEDVADLLAQLEASIQRHPAGGKQQLRASA
jgi:DNA end-binding protein Ku